MQSADIYAITTDHFLGPVRDLLYDDSVSEVLINGCEQVFCERKGKLELTGIRFASEAALLAAARNIAEYVNRDLDEDHHSVDARLPSGSRVHIIIPPASRHGVCISIRKFKKSTFDLGQLVKWGSLSPSAAEFLCICVMLHKNIVIAGGTGTGKTSMLNALSSAIPHHERVVVIEDSSELQLHLPHTIYLEAQPGRTSGGGKVTIRDLFVDSLRMRPDRIIVGEIRRGEALDLVQSMISGHAGAMTTVHASTPFDAAVRLETLSLMSDVALPLYVARSQVASALDLVVQITRLHDGTRRVKSISESLGLDKDNQYQFRDLFTLRTSGLDAEGRIEGELVSTGVSPSFGSEPYEMGLADQIDLTASLFQPPGASPAP